MLAEHGVQRSARRSGAEFWHSSGDDGADDLSTLGVIGMLILPVDIGDPVIVRALPEAAGLQ
jgi:hypothetical protein